MTRFPATRAAIATLDAHDALLASITTQEAADAHFAAEAELRAAMTDALAAETATYNRVEVVRAACSQSVAWLGDVLEAT